MSLLLYCPGDELLESQSLASDSGHTRRLLRTPARFMQARNQSIMKLGEYDWDGFSMKCIRGRNKHEKR